MTRQQFERYLDTTFSSGLHFGGTNYKSRREYDSLLTSGKKKDGWLKRQLTYKQIEINEEYDNRQQFISAFTHELIHSLPQMLFISLPLLALVLKLLYIRRKQFYYVSHGIFGIHLYIFVFIALLFIFALSRANSRLHSQALVNVSGVLIFGLFVYQYLAMKNFYKQGWAKTFLKFSLLNIIFSTVLSLLFVIFVFFSFLNI